MYEITEIEIKKGHFSYLFGIKYSFSTYEKC